MPALVQYHVNVEKIFMGMRNLRYEWQAPFDRELANSSSGLAEEERSPCPISRGLGGARDGRVTVDALSEPAASTFIHGKLSRGD